MRVKSFQVNKLKVAEDRLRAGLGQAETENENWTGGDSYSGKTADGLYPEVETIEIPVAKRVVFKINKPVKLEFA